MTGVLSLTLLASEATVIELLVIKGGPLFMMKDVFPNNWSFIFSRGERLEKNFAISYAPSAAQRYKLISKIAQRHRDIVSR